MASQYNLELKAILDTTQVKQELQKLRTLQNQISGKQGGVKTAGANNLNNLNSLNSTLAKLTNSLNQLNANIQKLNSFNSVTRNHAAANVNQRTPYSIPIGMQPQKMYQSQLKEVLNSVGNWERDHQVLRYVKDAKFRSSFNSRVFGAPGSGIAQMNAGLMGALPLYRAFQQIDPAEQALFKSMANDPKQRKLLLKQLKAGGVANLSSKPIAANASTQSILFNNPIIQSLGGLAAGAVADQIVRLSEVQGWGDEKFIGNVTKGGAVNLGGKAVSSGLMGVAAGSAAGLPGAVIGGAVGTILGVVQGTFENLVRSAELFNQALAESTSRLNEANRVDSATMKFFESKRDENAVKTKNLSYLNEELDIANRKYNRHYNFINNHEIINRDDLAAYEKETKRLIESKEYDANDPYILKRQKTANDYIMNFGQMIEADSRRTKIQTTIDAINNEKEAKAAAERQRSKSMADAISADDLLHTRYNQSQLMERLYDENDIKQLRLHLSNYEYHSNRNRDLYMSTKDLARRESDLDKKEKLISQYREYNSEWNYNASMVEKLTAMIEALTAQTKQKEIDSYDDRISILQEALSNLKAPDMTNVNSLAANGVQINSIDDKQRAEIMVNYQREQTELQKQIKQLLDEKAFVSTIK